MSTHVLCALQSGLRTCAHLASVLRVAERAHKPEATRLSIKGSGLVFVGSHGAEIRGPSRRGAGVYAWDTRHLSRYEVRPRKGTLRLRAAELLPDGVMLQYDLRDGGAEAPLRVDRRIGQDR
jgi:hypothetical protein